MATLFPGGTDSLTNPIGTQTLDTPDHAAQHTNNNDAIEAMQSNFGTNSGTNIHKNFVVGNFPVRMNSSSVLQQVIQGTIGTSLFANGTVGTSLIINGTINNATLGTPAIVGGTATSFVLSSPTIQSWNGWEDSNESWVTTGADTAVNTGTITVVADVTTKYSIGMKVKYTQGGTVIKGFISNVPAVASGTTTFTVYTGTFVPGATAITSNFYSTARAPQGFSLNPNDWSTIYTAGTDYSLSPASNAWVNPGTATLTIPIGLWKTYYFCINQGNTATNPTLFATLSTGTATESDVDFTTSIGASGAASINFSMSKEKTLSLTSKTVYFLNSKYVGTASILSFLGATYGPTIIRATSLFL